MIIDGQNLYSDAQALTATAASTNLIDHGADRNLGMGEPMCVVAILDVAADGTTGNETYTYILETDDNSSFSSATQVGAQITITRGDAAGTRYVLPIPPDTTMERYSRLSYTLGGTTPTVTVTAWLMEQRLLQNDHVYANGYTITR